MPKKYLIVLFFMAFAPPLAGQGSAFAAIQENGQPCPPECVTDSMEIVTWYPSPYNEYEELRLYPTQRDSGDCNNDKIGLMYYDHGGTPSFPDNDKMMICKGTLLGWQEVGGESFWKFVNNSDSDIYYAKSGNVGIGTTEPQSKLHIVGTSNAQRFDYTGGLQTYIVPSGVTSIQISAYGASGGGKGGHAAATINVTPGETLGIYVGGQPSGATGGYNGGGAGGSGGGGNGGGGASDVRRGATKLIVAGGGGGRGSWSPGEPCDSGELLGGDGGGTKGTQSNKGACSSAGGGGGGTQSGGGSAGGGSSTSGTSGNGGNGGSTGVPQGNGGGGGGGYYGGGGGTQGTYIGVGGGGGSSYVPAGGITTAGVNSGNAFIDILPLVSINIALKVSGDAEFTNGIARFADSNGTCTINPTSTALICSSDERLKKDITKLSSVSMLEKLSQLQGVNYKWINQTDETERFGFIAQEVEPIFPEFVSTDFSGYKSVAYGSFVPVLTEGIKDIASKIDLFSAPTSTPSIHIDSSGNVGIGTTAPSSKLQVTGGDAYIQTQGKGVILRATDGTNCYRIIVNNAGTLTTTLVTCP